MKKIMTTLAVCLSAVLLLAGCGANREMDNFRRELDEFCTAISDLDTAINNVDPDAADATDQVMKYLDQLDTQFHSFSELDFPKELDYLKPLAKEAGDYMSTAVRSYHDAYAGGDYNEELAEYARENSSRAVKRVQTIISFLHGDK